LKPENRRSKLPSVRYLEEGGYTTTAHQLIYTYYPMNGIANQVYHIVHCQALELAGQIDANEISGVRWLDRRKLSA
jgi:hypothetical protein